MAFLIFLLHLCLTYIRPYELFPALAPYRLMLIVGLVGVIAVMGSMPFNGFTFRAKQLPVLIGFALWTGMSVVFALRWFGGAVDALSTFGITLVGFFLAVFTVNSPKRLRTTVAFLIGLSLLLVLQEILAVHFGFLRELLVMEEVQANGVTLARARATGFMKDPNDLAQTLVFVMPFVALAWRRRDPVRNFLLVIVPIVILLYGIYLTHSRGAIISLAVIIFVALRSKLGNLLSGVAALTGAAGYIGLSARNLSMDDSARHRIEAWSQGLQLLKYHPFSGVGYGKFTDFNEITAHNSFVLCSAELGIPGFFLWMALLVITLMELSAVQKVPATSEADQLLRRYARSIQISFYGFLASAWFLSRTYVPSLYLLIALAISVSEIARRSKKPIANFSYPQIASRTVAAMMASMALVYLQIRIQLR